MPTITEHYLLESFLDGDGYIAASDRRRFSTIDNQLYRIAEIAGDGVIDGWEIVPETFPNVKVTLGSGLINGFHVNTFNDAHFSLSPQSTYYFYAQRRVGVTGTTGPKSDVVSVVYSDNIAPAQPQSLTGQGLANETVLLSWSMNTESDFSHYRVDRSVDGSVFDAIAETSASEYVDSTVQEDTTYWYRVYSLDLSGNISTGATLEIYVPSSDILPPDPIDVIVQESEYGLNVLWDHPKTISSLNRQGYKVSWVMLNSDYSEDPETLNSSILDAYSLQARIDGLINGRTYKVTVQTIDIKDRISQGLSFNAVPQPSPAPKDPTGIVADQHEGERGVRIRLTWSPDNDLNDPVVPYRYRIYVSVNGSPESLPIDVGLGRTSQDVELYTYNYSTYNSIPENALVTLRVTSLDASNQESAGNYIRFYTDIFSEPSRILNPESRFDPLSRMLEVKWQIQDDTVDVGLIISYDRLNDEYIGYQEVVNIRVGRSASYTLHNALPNTIYTVRLTPYNYKGIAGPYSELAELTPNIEDISLPAMPTDLRAVAGDREILLSWTPSSSKTASQYKIYRRNGTTSFVASHYFLVDTLPKEITRFTDYGLENNQTYTYYITTVDIYGRESLHISDGHLNLNFVSTVPKQQGILTDPGNFEAVVQGEDVYLSWDSLPEEFDGFTLYRSKDNLHHWQVIATLDRETFSYIDSNITLIDGTVWYYTIDKSVNDAEVRVQTMDLDPENSICLGEIKLNSSEFEDPNTTCRRVIDQLSDPVNEHTNRFLLSHRHRETSINDPERISLDPELVVTDWVSKDGLTWTTNEDITGTSFLLKVNGSFPEIYYSIIPDIRQIMFAEPISNWENAQIEMRVLGIEEVQGELSSDRFNRLHARQVQFGRLAKEQLPAIGHEGRIRETMYPDRFLLERYSDNIFIVPSFSKNPSKSLGDGTTFFSVSEADGDVEEFADWDQINDGEIVCFQRPSYSDDTILNLRQWETTGEMGSFNDCANLLEFKKNLLLGLGFVSSTNTTFYLDPSTLQVSWRRDIGMSGQSATIDYRNGKLFIMAANSAHWFGRLCEVDPSDWTIIRSVLLSLDPMIYSLSTIEYADGKLYLLANYSGSQYLFEVNSNSGVCTQIGSPNVGYLGRSMVYIDDGTNGQMYILSRNTSTSQDTWGTINLLTNEFSALGVDSVSLPQKDFVYHKHDQKVYYWSEQNVGFFVTQYLRQINWDTFPPPPLMTTVGSVGSGNRVWTLASPDSDFWQPNPTAIRIGDYFGLRSNAYLRLQVDAPSEAKVGQAKLVLTPCKNVGAAIVDNTDSGFTKQEMGHNFITGTSTGSHKFNISDSDYFYVTTVPGPTPTATCRWTPYLPLKGKYKVDLWYMAGSNRSNKVRYTVHDIHGDTVVFVSQFSSFANSQWSTLGVFEFDEGENGYVEMSNVGTPTVAIANAVRFTPVEMVSTEGPVHVQISVLDPSWMIDSTDLTHSVMSEIPYLASTLTTLPEWGSDSVEIDITDLIQSFTSRPGYKRYDHVILAIDTIESTPENSHRNAYGFWSQFPPKLVTRWTRDFAGVDSKTGGFQSQKSYRINFEFQDNEPTRWLRLTTENAPIFPNPIVDLKKRLRFRILLQSGSLYVALGIRQIQNSSGEIGSDGGTFGPIEWVGTYNPYIHEDGYVVPRGKLISASPDWQEIDIDLYTAQTIPYDNGLGKLSNRYGVLEHIAFTINPDDPNSTGPFDVYIDRIQQINDLLVAGTSQGILTSDDFGTNWTPRRLTDAPVHKFYKAINNEYLWAISATQALIAVDPANWYVLNGLTGVQIIRDIVEDNDGNMYVSTDKGVYFFDISLIRSLSSFRQTRPIYPLTTQCYAMYSTMGVSGSGEIWVSTEAGIFVTNDQGSTWSNSGLSTAGFPCYKFINIGTKDDPVILAATKQYILRKTPTDMNFVVIADFEEQHAIHDIWTFQYLNGRLFVSTGSGIYVNEKDGLLNSSIRDFGFKRAYNGMDINGSPVTSFCLDLILNQNQEYRIMAGQENRLWSLNEDGTASIKTYVVNKELPSFYVDDQEVNIGYTYNAFNGMIVFWEPVEVNSVVSASYLPRRKWAAKEGGWSQTNPEADVFIYRNGIPTWLDFALNKSAIQGEVQLIRSALLALPELNSFNSLFPKSIEQLATLQSTIDTILLDSSENSTIDTRSIVAFVDAYTRFLSMIKRDVANAARLYDPIVSLMGIPRSQRKSSSRANILESKEGFTSSDSTGIQVDAYAGEVDFTQVWAQSTDPGVRQNFTFNKYDRMEISVFKSQVRGSGDHSHEELEDRMEDINSGMPCYFGRDVTGNLIRLGVFLESRHNYLLDRYNATPIHSKFYSAYTSGWYDMINSTIDYHEIVSSDVGIESRICLSAMMFQNDPYYADKIWLGTDNGILQYLLDDDWNLVLEKTIHPCPEQMSVDYIYRQQDDEVYIIATDSSRRSKIFVTNNFGFTWTEFNTINLPDRLYCFAIINGVYIVTTSNGIYYCNNTYGTWFRSYGLGENFNKPVFNLSTGTYILAEADGYFCISQSGIEFTEPGGRITNNNVSAVNRILRFKNITWVGTDRGLYSDSNSVISSSAAFKLEIVEDTAMDSASVVVNDVVNGLDALYCCGSNGKIYRYWDENEDDEIGNEWKSYQVPDFGPIHRIILYEGVKHYLVVISYDKIKTIDVTPGSGVYG